MAPGPPPPCRRGQDSSQRQPDRAPQQWALLPRALRPNPEPHLILSRPLLSKVGSGPGGARAGALPRPPPPPPHPSRSAFRMGPGLQLPGAFLHSKGRAPQVQRPESSCGSPFLQGCLRPHPEEGRRPPQACSLPSAQADPSAGRAAVGGGRRLVRQASFLASPGQPVGICHFFYPREPQALTGGPLPFPATRGSHLGP